MFLAFASEKRATLTSSSVADLLGPTTAFVLSALAWDPGLRMPETHDIRPPPETEATGFLSAGALGPKELFTLASGRWTGLASGVDVWERTP